MIPIGDQVSVGTRNFILGRVAFGPQGGISRPLKPLRRKKVKRKARRRVMPI